MTRWRVSESASSRTYSVFLGDEYVSGGFVTRESAEADMASRAENQPATNPDTHGNRVRQEGVDRCPCGSKYWEDDRCIDCGNTEPIKENT